MMIDVKRLRDEEIRQLMELCRRIELLEEECCRLVRRMRPRPRNPELDVGVSVPKRRIKKAAFH